MKFLITAGGTAEPVDAVRVLTNISSGHTGAVLARDLRRQGHRVTLLRAATAEAVPEVQTLTFHSFADLDNSLRELLAREDFDVLVHAAAVSDFTVDKIVQQGAEKEVASGQKIESAGGLILYLKPTFKIIDRLLQYSRNRPVVVGFKLTGGANAEQARAAVLKVKADWVVHNDMTDIRAHRRIFTLYRQGEVTGRVCSVEALACWLGGLDTASVSIGVGQAKKQI